MLGVLVVVLGRDLVTAQGRIARQRKVASISLVGIAGDSLAASAAGGRRLSANRAGSATLHVSGPLHSVSYYGPAQRLCYPLRHVVVVLQRWQTRSPDHAL